MVPPRGRLPNLLPFTSPFLPFLPPSSSQHSPLPPQSLLSLVRGSPHVAIVPLLAFVVLAAVGTWAVCHVAAMEADDVEVSGPVSRTRCGRELGVRGRAERPPGPCHLQPSSSINPYHFVTLQCTKACLDPTRRKPDTCAKREDRQRQGL